LFRSSQPNIKIEGKMMSQQRYAQNKPQDPN